MSYTFRLIDTPNATPLYSFTYQEGQTIRPLPRPFQFVSIVLQFQHFDDDDDDVLMNDDLSTKCTRTGRLNFAPRCLLLLAPAHLVGFDTGLPAPLTAQSDAAAAALLHGPVSRRVRTKTSFFQQHLVKPTNDPDRTSTTNGAAPATDTSPPSLALLPR